MGELAFFVSTDGRPTDVEMLRALRPCTATTGGELVILSSPYGQTSALFQVEAIDPLEAYLAENRRDARASSL
ncbi:MAG TPA: hypothetical protein VFD92_01230 [Candidatus Binatia bacterium]|nr:hypothetical protein [Candidatus Binatia bacterium]